MWYNGKSVIKRDFFFLDWNERGIERERGLLYLVKKQGDLTFLFLPLDIDMRGCDILELL